MDKSSLLSLFLSSKFRTLLWLAAPAALFAHPAAAQPQPPDSAQAQLLPLVVKDAAHWQQVSKQVWDFAELGDHETKSSNLMQEQLEAAGFKVQTAWLTNRRPSSGAMARASRWWPSWVSLTHCRGSRSKRCRRGIR